MAEGLGPAKAELEVEPDCLVHMHKVSLVVKSRIVRINPFVGELVGKFDVEKLDECGGRVDDNDANDDVRIAS